MMRTRTLRASLVALALAFATMPPLAAPCAGFVDVADADTFCPNVESIKDRSITLGCTATAHCPTNPVGRLQMAAFLSRLSAMLVPPVYDALGRLVGYFTPLPSPSGSQFRFVASSRLGETYYLLVAEDLPRQDLVLRYSPVLTDTFFELPDRSTAGLMWLAAGSWAPDGLPTDRCAFVGKKGANTDGLLAFVKREPSGEVTPISGRIYPTGECILAQGFPADFIRVTDLGPRGFTFPLTIRQFVATRSRAMPRPPAVRLMPTPSALKTTWSGSMRPKVRWRHLSRNGALLGERR